LLQTEAKHIHSGLQKFEANTSNTHSSADLQTEAKPIPEQAIQFKLKQMPNSSSPGTSKLLKQASTQALQTEANPIHFGLQYFEASILQIESNTHSMSGLQTIRSKPIPDFK
jgi:hypothetical protein